MIKIFVILLLCGIISAQDATTGIKPQEKLFPKLNIFKKPLTKVIGNPLGRLRKRDSAPPPNPPPAPPAIKEIIEKFRQSMQDRRKQRVRPARGLKYYFKFDTQNGGCGCGNSGGGGGSSLSQNVNCKCVTKPETEKDAATP